MNNHSNFSRKKEIAFKLVLLKFVFLFLILILFPSRSWSQLTPVQRWTGTVPGDGFGFFVNKLGDKSSRSVNNPRQDGVPDIIISKSCDGFNCKGEEGSVSVYSGADSSLIFQIQGTAWSEAVDAGDLNGDGVSDILVGESFPNGRARVFSGLDGSPVSALTFYGENGDPHFGSSVSGIADITGDGIPDLIVGDGETRGSVVLFSGADGSRIGKIDNPEEEDLQVNFGESISDAGDVNGDGTSDFIVSANQAGHDGKPARRSYVFSGKSDLEFPLLYYFDGETNGDRSGNCCGTVVSVGDMNGDGKSELAVTTPGASPDGRMNAGTISILDGSTGAPLPRFDGQGPMLFSGENPGDLLGGEPSSGQGWVSSVGDVNGDGYPDFIAVAIGAEVQGIQKAGRVLVFSGYDASVLMRIDSPDPRQTPHSFGVSGTVMEGRDRGDAVKVVIGSGDPFTGLLEPGGAYLFNLVLEDRNALAGGKKNAVLSTDHSGSGPDSIVINDIVYALNDLSRLGIPQILLKAYDPTTGQWIAKAPLPSAREGVAFCVAGGFLYAIGGYGEAGPVGTVEAYDPVADSWSTKASLPSVSREFSVTASGSLLYVVGRFDREERTWRVESYDPVNDEWRSRPSVPTSASDLTADVVNGLLYVHGKSGETIHAYDPIDNQWSSKGRVPSLRMGQSIHAVDGNRLVIGEDKADGLVETAIYDPVADSWNPRVSQ